MPDLELPRDYQDQIYAGITESVSAQTRMTWMPLPDLFVIEEGRLTVYSQNQFNNDWLKGHYGDKITQIAQKVLGREIGIDFTADKARYDELGGSSEELEPTSTEAKTKVRMRSPEKTIPYILQDSNWIQHPGNAMAFAKAHEVINSAVDREQIAYPICFIGRNGVGKTALLSYIAKEVIKQGKYAGYLDIDNLSSYLRESHGKEGSGIAHMKRSHVLLIDSLERLVHNDKHREGCQKRITEVMDLVHSHKVPLACSFVGDYEKFREFIDKISESNTALSSRFSGLERIVVSPPVPEGRQEFILSLLKANNGVSESLDLSLIAEHMDKIFPRETSIRDMQGEIRTIMNRAEAGNITLSQLYDILGYGGYEAGEQINLIRGTDPTLVLGSLVDFFPHISREDVLGQSNDEGVRNVRDFAAYALMKISGLTPREIAGQLNRKEGTVKLYIERMSKHPQQSLDDMMDHINEIIESKIN